VLVTAASNEVMRQETREFFAQPASNCRRQDFANALAVVPNVVPVKVDEKQEAKIAWPLR
jgi:hypothetical protein